MPWVRLEDSFADHPKIERVGPLASWLHVAALCYCARHLTDGRLPKVKASRLADVASPETHVDALLRVGLWHEDGDDYVIHDYLDYQPSRADVETERSAARDRMAKHRAKADVGAKSARSRSPKVTANNGRSSASPSRPDPNTSVLSSTGNSRAGPQPVDNPDDDKVPAAVWTHYAQLKLERQPAGKVSNPSSYKSVTTENAKTELGAQALRWWTEFDVTPNQLAQCLVDGKAPAAHYRRKAPA